MMRMIATQPLGDCSEITALACARPLLWHQSYGTVSTLGRSLRDRKPIIGPKFPRNGFNLFLYVQFGYAAFASAIAERFDTAENT